MHDAGHPDPIPEGGRGTCTLACAEVYSVRCGGVQLRRGSPESPPRRGGGGHVHWHARRGGVSIEVG